MPSSYEERYGKQNHYKTLGLPETCSAEDVKDAFIRLSKAHHPDYHPTDPSQNDKFVRIYEAYSVLSRPQRRLIYDSDLHHARRMNYNYASEKNGETDAPRYRWRDESIWHMRDKSRENFDPNKPYYGIKGINRVSNYWIAGGAVIVMMIGACMHYTAFRHTGAFSVDQLNTRDERLARQLFITKLTAKSNRNDVQIHKLSDAFGWESEPDKSKGKIN